MKNAKVHRITLVPALALGSASVIYRNSVDARGIFQVKRIPNQFQFFFSFGENHFANGSHIYDRCTDALRSETHDSA